MLQRFQIPLPMWRIHYQLLGGHRRVLGAASIIFLAVSIGAIVLQRGTGQPLAEIANWALSALPWGQSALLLLGGCNAIHRAILRDFESKMVESHRLSPMSSGTVVLGYLIGSTLQILSVFALLTVIGMLACFVTNYSVRDWLAGNLLLLAAVLPIWCVAVFFGQKVTKPTGLAVAVVVAAPFTQVLVFLPAAAFLINLYPIVAALTYMSSKGNLPEGVVVPVMLCCVVNGLFWIYMASIKFRRPDLPAICGLRGLFLVGAAMVSGAIGLLVTSDPTAAVDFRVDDAEAQAAQWIATLAGGMLLTFVVVSGTVQSQIAAARGTVMSTLSNRMKWPVVALCGVVAVILPMFMIGSLRWAQFPFFYPAGGRADDVNHAWLYTGLAMLVSIWTVAMLVEIGCRLWNSSRGLLIAYVPLVMAGPPLLDLARAASVNPGLEGDVFSWIMACSPIGTMVACWNGFEVSLVPGLILQTLLASALTLVVWRIRSGRLQKS